MAAPHAMPYDTAVLVPCALAGVARLSLRSLPSAALMLGLVTQPVALAAFILTCGTPLATWLDRWTAALPTPRTGEPSSRGA